MRDGWTETTLGDIAKCAGGTAFPHEFQGGDTGTPFVKVSDMNESGNERYLISSNNYVSKEAIKSLGARVWPRGTIVFAKVGAALLTEKRRILVKDTIFDNNIMGLVPKASIESHFLYLFMETVKLGDFVQPGAVPSVNNSIVSEIAIKLPPPSEQGRIVDVVSSIDAYIDALQQKAFTARTARNAVLHDLLSAGGDDWTESDIGSECVVKGGKRLPKGTLWSANPTAHPYIRATDFKNGRIDTSNLVYVPEDVWSVVSRYVVQAGDVLITIAGTIGAIALVPSSHIGANLTENAALIRPVNESVDSEFLYLWLRSNDAQRQITDLTIGTTQQKLGLFRIESIRLPLPPLGEQKRIVEIVSSMDEVIQSTEQAVVDARNLRSGLLSDLLSGEHEIPKAYDRFLRAA